MTDIINGFAEINRRRALSLGAGAVAASLSTGLDLSTSPSMAADGKNALTQVRNATLRIDCTRPA